MEPVFLGSHPAIDFVNTNFSPQGAVVEVIGDGKSLLGWMLSAGLLDAAAVASIRRRYSGAPLDAVAAEARKLRVWVTEWIDQWSHRPQDDYAAQFRRLNALLERCHSYREIVRTRDGAKVVQHEHMSDVGELLGLICDQVALLIATENPELLRQCAGEGCTLRFLDRTKAHRRLFCSAAACGNRAKVAAFRNRQRG